MRKQCQTCGNDFEAKEAFHKYCPRCIPPANSARSRAATAKPKRNNINDMLIKEYYDQEGNLKKEIFLGTPQKIADIFVIDKLKTKQLRDFHSVISKARKKATLKGIEAVRATLYKCQADTAYQFTRGFVPSSFVQFMEHHLAIAEKDEKSLEAYFQHFDSIVCYFPKN